MNVLIVKEDGNKPLDDFVENVEKYYKNNSDDYDINLKFITDKKTKLKIDEILIISDYINFIEENFYSFNGKKRVLIITNNFDSKHILACLLLTENLFSAKKDPSYILNKIFNVYKEDRYMKEFSGV